MEKDRIEMSQRERDVLKVMSLVLKGQRTQEEAGRLLGRSVRQIRRVQRRLEKEGDGAVVHRLRGKTSNRALDASVKTQVLAIYRKHYGDFGPTLAAEKIFEKHGLSVARETLRQWLLKEGLWQRKRRHDKHRSRRERRACFGELVQADASEHDWLEGRGQRMVLLGIIDDATSLVMLRFYPAETTEAYMDLLQRWLKQHGRPVAWYSDRDSVFEMRNKGGELVATQFSRALEELGIRLIAAYSPQAKGRVERLWGTSQDRLVKELRLAEASTMEQANAVLEKMYQPWFNRTCTIKAASGNDAHRLLGREHDLAAILSIQEERTVCNDYTIQIDKQVFQLLPPVWPGERGGKVIVEKRLDAEMKVRFKERYLEYRKIESRRQEEPGAPPPRPEPSSGLPRSLAHGRIPAAPAESKGRVGVKRTRPTAVHSTAGCSGRTPALPCPSDGKGSGKAKELWRPGPDHPWKRTYGKRKADISIGRK